MVIFHSYVKLPEGILSISLQFPLLVDDKDGDYTENILPNLPVCLLDSFSIFKMRISKNRHPTPILPLRGYLSQFRRSLARGSSWACLGSRMEFPSFQR